MAQKVDIPNIGIIEFPDGMSDDDIATAIKTKIIPQYQASQPPKSAGEKFMEPLKSMSVEDWKQKSILYPTAQMVKGALPFVGDQATFEAGMKGVREKGDQLVEGAKYVVQNPMEAARRAYDAIMANPAGVAGEMVKGAIYDPEMMRLPAPVGRAVGSTIAAPVRGAANVAGAAADVASGAYGTITGKIAKPGAIPKSWQRPSVRQPVGNEYVSPESLAAWRSGEIPASQVEWQPITNLPQSALARTGGMVPMEGQGWRAYGEQLGQTYRNPANLLTDIGLDMLTGGGMPTAARMGYKGYNAIQQSRAANQLSKAGFTHLTPAEQAELAAARAELPPGGPIEPPPGGMPPPPPPSPPPPVNTNIPAFQRANRNIPGVNGPAVPPVEPPAAPTPPPAGSVAGPAVPQLTYSPTPTTMYAGQYGAAGGDINQVAAADFANKYNPALNFKPSLPPAAQAPAQAAATQAGITPPINAIESGFNKELTPAITAPAVPETLPAAVEPVKAVRVKRTPAPAATGMSALEELTPKSEITTPVVEPVNTPAVKGPEMTTKLEPMTRSENGAFNDYPVYKNSLIENNIPYQESNNSIKVIGKNYVDELGEGTPLLTDEMKKILSVKNKKWEYASSTVDFDSTGNAIKQEWIIPSTKTTPSYKIETDFTHPDLDTVLYEQSPTGSWKKITSSVDEETAADIAYNKEMERLDKANKIYEELNEKYDNIKTWEDYDKVNQWAKTKFKNPPDIEVPKKLAKIPRK